MRLSAHTNNKAIPWEFDAEEVARLNEIFNDTLVRSYLQSLKYLALSNRLVAPNGNNLQDVKAANDYMAGQEFTIDALLSTPLYTNKQKGA